MEEKDNRVRNWSIATIAACIGLLFPVNRAYVEWHSTFVHTIVDASLSEIKESIAATQNTANQSSDKIDFLVKAEAARNVEALTTQLILVKASSTGTPNELRTIGELEQRIARAILYRDCVINDKPNCDAFRVW